MRKNQHLKHVLDINLAMLFISTSGVLGRYISQSPPVTIFWRALLAAVFLFIFCRWKKIDLKINWSNDAVGLLLSGIFLGAHWVTFFYSLKLSNVAIGMLTLFTYPIFTALLEPLLLNTKFNKRHLILGFFVLVGIYLLAPDFNSGNSHIHGIAFGLLSSLFYSLRNLLMKNKVSRYQGSTLMLYQLIIVATVLSPVLFVFESSGMNEQWPALITLALFTTAIGHTLFVIAFKHFSVSAASIIGSSQPIYAIILGMIFLNEIPEIDTVLGGTFILASVVIESIGSFKPAQSS